MISEGKVLSTDVTRLSQMREEGSGTGTLSLFEVGKEGNVLTQLPTTNHQIHYLTPAAWQAARIKKLKAAS